MKKFLPALLSIFLTVSAFGACDFTGNFGEKTSGETSSILQENSSVEQSAEGSEESAESVVSSSEEENSGADSIVDSSDSGNIGGDVETKDFTASEKALFNEYFGFVIPFVESNEYYVEEYELYYDTTDETEIGLNFYAYDNTKAEFNAYKALFTTSAGYTYDGTDTDEYGDDWYYYSRGDYYIDMSYYLTDDGSYVIDVYVYELFNGDLTQGGGADDGGDIGGGNTQTGDFTASEKALFNEYFGFVIPFVESNEYYVEEYELYYDTTDETEIGLNFYAYDNTKAEFNAYKALFTTSAGYTYDGTDTDEYGDDWYYYSRGDYYIDMSYYLTDDGSYVIDVYVYELFNGDLTQGGGADDGGDIGGGETNVDMITNNGKGLPTDADGVYDIDFTKATYVKNVTEQGYYIDGCPTTGNINVLVIPVEFSDLTAASKGYSLDKIEKAFNGAAGSTDYVSVSDYYYQSSYGKLDVQFTVLDSWFRPAQKSSYYAKATVDYFGEQVEGGDMLIMNEALAYLESRMDLSLFDSDNNAILDAVVMINTLDIDSNVNFQWAYRYWNVYTDNDGNYYEYDGVSANDYMWASYQFIMETYDAEGNSSYNGKGINTYTYIHEFGHVLGADDYYDTAYAGNITLEGCDIMDGMTGDHNAYTKFNYGWLTSSRLVVAENSVTLTLEDFSKNGDTIIIANNWDADLGVYQEYYVLMYYTNNGLNAGDDYGYFSRDGIVMYHVNASLYKEEVDGEVYYDIYNNNTDASDDYGTKDNLIEFVKSADGTFTYVAEDASRDSLANIKDDNGNKIAYTFTVDSMTETSATITFTKNK